MSFSAKRSAYSDMPSFSSQSAICCIAAQPISLACASGSAAHRVYPTRCEIEGRFLAGLMFLPSLLATADEVFE